MFSYQQPVIAPGARFHHTNYPQLLDRLAVIELKSVHMPLHYKPGLLITYTRDHSMNVKWMEANPTFAGLLLSGTLPLQDIERLFARCKRQKLFTAGLESYIHDWFTEHHVHSMITKKDYESRN